MRAETIRPVVRGSLPSHHALMQEHHPNRLGHDRVDLSRRQHFCLHAFVLDHAAHDPHAAEMRVCLSPRRLVHELASGGLAVAYNLDLIRHGRRFQRNHALCASLRAHVRQNPRACCQTEIHHAPAPRSSTVLSRIATSSLPRMAFLYAPVRETSPIMFAWFCSEALG